MSTWVVHATAHASLTSGFGAGPMPAFGSASLYWFALGTSATVLAFLVMKSPRPLNLPWRLADLWSLAARLAQGRRRRVRPQVPISARSRLRQRVDLMLLQMLGDDVEEHAESCPVAAGEPHLDPPPAGPAPPADPPPAGPAPPANPAAPAGKHRLAGPPKDSRGRKRAPRHAAPPASSTATVTAGKEPAAESASLTSNPSQPAA